MKKQNEQLAELQKQADEWKNKYLRALADYQNLEKRMCEEKEMIRRFAAEVVIGRLLPIVDSLGKAKEHLKDAGLELTYKELKTALEQLGIEQMIVVGQDFDPHKMECVEAVVGQENKVIEEVLPGYKLNGKIIRIAKVKVGKKEVN